MFKNKVVTISLILLFSVGTLTYTHASPIDAMLQSASVWQSILGWFGMGGENTNQGGASNNSDVYSSDSFVNGSANYSNGASDYTPVRNHMLNMNFGNDNFACLPTFLRGEDNLLISYSCPDGSKLSGSNFNAEGNYGIRKISPDKEKYYVECESEEGKTRMECSIKAIAPEITKFEMNPAHPAPGERASLAFETSGTERCRIYNKNLSINKVGTSGIINFIAQPSDTITISCTDKTGLDFKKSLNYSNN